MLAHLVAIILLHLLTCTLIKNIMSRLTYLLTHNLLPGGQYGFCRDYCTNDQTLFFTQNVRDAKNDKTTRHSIAEPYQDFQQNVN